MSRERDYDNDDWEKCAACDEGVERLGAFQDPKTKDWFHPECAGVEQCAWCGEWADKSALVDHDKLRYHPACVEIDDLTTKVSHLQHDLFCADIEAKKVKPVIEAMMKLRLEDFHTEDWPNEELHDAVLYFLAKSEPWPPKT